MLELKNINVEFDFTTDSVNYWDGFWERNNGLGAGGSDPDVTSKTLQEYHCLLWSRKLPNGDEMKLMKGTGSNYLTWNDFRFGSDSITASFRYNKYKTMIEDIRRFVPNYNEFMESYIRKSYTIGGSIIFPKRMGGINQSRGCNFQIKDRWDLTLECIKRFYDNEESPLSISKDTLTISFCRIAFLLIINQLYFGWAKVNLSIILYQSRRLNMWSLLKKN